MAKSSVARTGRASRTRPRLQATRHQAASASAGTIRLVKEDPSLAPYAGALEHRAWRLADLRDRIDCYGGGLEQFASAYEYFGVHPKEDGAGVVLREWAPGATKLSLVGDFNGWDEEKHVGVKDDATGVWTVDVAPGELKHGDRIRLSIVTEAREAVSRIPAWVRSVKPAEDGSPYHDGIYWSPPDDEAYRFENERPRRPAALRIYEAHVGMSGEDERVATYAEFTDLLPRIKAQGYNAVQLMAIQEHALYSSFGYQVTNFFAVAHRSGSPEDLKALVDEAHRLGMMVLLDVVHAHASDNALDGLNGFDGRTGGYFHEGPLGWHSLWGTRMFNFGDWNVLRFLLSNVRFWMEEYRFDGFRFDGVTAMLYKHRGVHWEFLGGLDEYFGEHADVDAALYLMLANEVTRLSRRDAVTVAEDVSGQAGVCRPIAAGGLGFDMRLGMGPPDRWIELGEQDDFAWSPGTIVHMLTGRRAREGTVAYVESHDQCLVGGKTLAHALMSPDIYFCMHREGPESAAVRRGIALHNVARLLTFFLGGDAWLNFMGNEFGHPEWVDFPREGNDQSFKNARRQWSLADDPELRYSDLLRFDAALMSMDDDYGVLARALPPVSHVNDDSSVLCFRKGDLVVICNLHGEASYPHYRVGVAEPGRYELVLDTDAAEFGGDARVDPKSTVCTWNEWWDGLPHSACFYAPTRSAQVYRLAEHWDLESKQECWDQDHGCDDDGTGCGGLDDVWW